MTGASNTFSSGVDLASMVGDGGANYEEPFETCVDALINYKKPLIAAVDGIAIGGGATILLHFDAVFISPNAKVKYPFSDLGLAPEVTAAHGADAHSMRPAFAATNRIQHHRMATDPVSRSH